MPVMDKRHYAAGSRPVFGHFADYPNSSNLLSLRAIGGKDGY